MDFGASFGAMDRKRQVGVAGVNLRFDRTPNQKVGLDRCAELGLNGGGIFGQRDGVLIRRRLFDKGKNEEEDRCDKAAD